MYFKQYYLGCLAHASYLIGDVATGTAVVVDPQRDIDLYVADASANGLTIKHVILTHFHADFLAGHLELRDKLGADIWLGARGKADYPVHAVEEGDELVAGTLKLRFLETPGHTPEGISVLVYDLEKSAGVPESVLTGDTLFIGDVGRPDLLGSIGFSAADLGKMLYQSLTQKLLTLPDETKVYPAHGAGSLCGKNLSKDTVSTIGIQRRYNYALQPMSEERFVALVTEGQPDIPQYFLHDAILNRQERPTLETTLREKLRPLSVAQVREAVASGAQLIDVRDANEFAGAHMKGSVNIGLGGQYATWAGTLLDRERLIVIVAEPGNEPEAGIRLGRIGYDHIGGYLEDGMAALEHLPELVESSERISPGNLLEELEAGHAMTLVDVRTAKEREAGTIGGVNLHIPLSQLEQRIGEIPADQRVVVYCGGGYRSSAAVSMLQKHGLRNVQDVLGGYGAWCQMTGGPAASCPTA